ncbi:MAG TPA: glycosyltransferase family 39 protein [Chitinophaga sp.]
MKYFLIALVAAVLFIPFLGAVHLFDWDEINFAEAAREMIVSHNYLQVQIDFQPFWEKPPLFIWMQAGSMLLFGVNEFAARFPNAVTGILTLVTFYAIGKKLVSEKFGAWWALLYAGCWLPHFYFKSGIIDPTFNYFIFLAVYCVYRIGFSGHKIRLSVFAGICLGLAVLTKGPVAVLVSGLTLAVYFVVNRFRTGARIGHLLLVALFAALTTGAWFGIEIVRHGWWFVNQFVTYQVRLFRTEDAGHGGPFFYHWIILLVGCFPGSIFLFGYLQRRRAGAFPEKTEVRDFTKWMWVLFWVVLLLFSIVKTKIVHYSSLCYFPLSFLAAYQVHRLLEGRAVLKQWQVTLLLFIGVVLGLAIGALPLAGLYKAHFIPQLHDRFAVGNLQADVPWSMAECAYGLGYAALVIVSAVLLFRKKVQAGLLCLFCSTILAIQVTVVHFVPKVEAYSQRAAIEYFQSFVGKDVYVQPLDYKSYAHLFYTKKAPSVNPHYYEKGWLLNGLLDKPAYFICRVNNSDHWRTDERLEWVGEKNGFVFFKRK